MAVKKSFVWGLLRVILRPFSVGGIQSSTEAYTDEDSDGIYTVAATDGTDAALMLTAYENETEAVEIEVSGLSGKYEVKVSLLDEEHSLDQIFAFSAEGVIKLSLSAKKSSVTLVEIKKI